MRRRHKRQARSERCCYACCYQTANQPEPERNSANPRLRTAIFLRLFPLDDALSDIHFRLLHGVELLIPAHLAIVLAILVH